MSKVDDPKHAKDDGQSERENDIDRSHDETVKKLHDDKLDIHSVFSFRTIDLNRGVYPMT
jgi:hypothetical protein